MRKLHALAIWAGAIIGSLAVAVPAAKAQGCAMCYQNAAAAAQPGRIGLQYGILILGIPALGWFAVILGLLCARRPPLTTLSEQTYETSEIELERSQRSVV
jgi:hypothetical protein